MKKRYLLLAVIIPIIFLVTGCTSLKNIEKSMTCSRSMNQNDMRTNLNYKVFYKNNYVTRVKSEESIETSSTSTLNTYKEQIEKIYSPYKDIKFYQYNVTINDNKLVSTVDINYEKIDTKKLIEIDSANSQLIKNGKVKLSDVRSLYEQLGATCK
ncbi:MAG: DUF1307 domain-containing protein [bacterium]|nr:DUF1307 domain-containing protein [bacterium]